MYDSLVHRLKWAALFAMFLACSPLCATAADEQMLDMDLASLMDIQITSAGRKEQTLSDVPASVYVIDQEKLKKSGATSIPEALRLVPGLQVARINSNHWAISSRGFNGTFSNKLLVQIDGRSIYVPSYSGVYWDMQSILLEDVDRIEVIRGPGATLWGANAVNGIINIITREASQTQDGLVELGTGNHERQIANVRIGTKLNADTYARIYALHNERDSFENYFTGADGEDEWHNSQAGFRMDGDVGTRHSWTLQGDYYQGESSQDVVLFTIPEWPYNSSTVDNVDLSGGNLLGRWNYKDSNSGSWSLQAYYDYTSREEIFFEQDHHTFDLDLQHRFQPAKRHDLIWGIGYRMVEADYTNSYQVSVSPESETSHLFSGFIQDEITLIEDKVWLTVGSKIEHNDYTGVEFQPNIRILWKPGHNQSVWASVSHAVRTPSKIEDSVKIIRAVIPSPPVLLELSINGTSDMDSEKLTAWEMGYRYSPSSSFSMDLAAFYNRYSDLQGYVDGTDSFTEYFDNNMKGHSYGLEFSVNWSPVKWMDTEFSYSWIQLNVTGDEYTTKFTEGGTPSQQAAIRTSFDLNPNLQLNLWARYTGRTNFQYIQSTYPKSVRADEYVALDANLNWKINDRLSLVLAGQNLLDGEHLEFVPEPYISVIEVKRSVYTKLTWRF